jgi:1-phosphatidylinositol phosphodiesterase
MELVRELEGGYPDWMGALPDGTSMRSLTIPGTHDSGTTNGASMSDISDVTHNLEVTISRGLVVAQDRSIYDQLFLGIRFLDIRCNNNFGIQHGDFTISNISFETVLNDCKRFLHDHPHEIILMSVKHEDKNDFPGFAGMSAKFL